MKYLRKFATEAEYKAFAASEYEAPNVSLLADSGAVKYNLPLGVFIQHIDGSLYDIDEWAASGFAGDDANGVAVRSIAASFVIAKSNPASKAWSANANTAIEGVMLTTDSAMAETDYAGFANTALIVTTDTSGAAKLCAEFTFPNGAKGYLPSLGEWVIAYGYKAEISEALSLIGGVAFVNSQYFWSSTQQSASKSWRIYWGSGKVSTDSKGFTNAVRPFTTL